MSQPEFKKVDSTEPVIKYLAATIKEHLDTGQRVLWLATGGSSIAIDAAVARLLAGQDLRNLTVTLSDERYVPLEHKDSNWQQLNEAGFNLPGANLQPVLAGKDMVQTLKDYADILESAIEAADYGLGFIGVGPDGHIAGMLPGSPALESKAFAAGYQGPDFKRLTMTIPAIEALDEVVTSMMGEAKHQAIGNLSKDLSISEQPVQILKKLKKVTVFNDFKGDKL